MENIAIIRLDRDIVLKPSLGELQKWLPGIHHSLAHSRRFDARYMISLMADVFGSQLSYNITSDTIVKGLDELLTRLASTPFAAFPVGTRLYRSMEDCLSKDLECANTDLRRTRQGFLVFCLLARLTQSQALSGSIVGFLRRYVYDIVHSEEPDLFKEWCIGVVVLQDLVASRTLMELLHCFSGVANRVYRLRLQPAWYDPRAEMMMRSMMEAQHYPFLNNQRERVPLMLEGPAASLQDRSLRVGCPRLYHRRHRHLQIAYPWARPNEYFDEVGRLQYQQEEMNMKIDNIDRKLDYLF